MSAQDKSDAARGWRYVEKLLAEENDDGAPDTAFGADELMAAADAKLAQRKAEAANAPPEPSPPAASPPGIAPVVPIRRRWTRPLVVASALAAGVFLYLIVQPPPRVGSAPPDRHTTAEKIRDEAEASCAARQWDACERSLNRAREMDPTAEEEPRAMNARKAIAAGRAGVGVDGG